MANLSTTPDLSAKTPEKHAGGCHCGAVRFEVELEPGFRAGRCNCSICAKVAQTGVIMKPHAFRLVQGQDALAHYAWGQGISTRHFCKHCGIHCYGSGELEVLGGAFVSANLNCLDDVDVNELTLVYWDGRHDNWMAGPRSTPWPRFVKGSTEPGEKPEPADAA